MEYEPFVIDWDQHGPYVIATRGDLPDIIGSDEVALLATCGLLAPRGGTDEQIQSKRHTYRTLEEKRHAG